MTVRRVSESLPRIRAFVALRYTLIIAVAYLVLVEHKFSSPPTGLILLIVAALTSNVVMSRLPVRITDSTAFNASIIIGDTAWITATFLYSSMFGADFFYIYFFLLLFAAIGESLGLIVVGTIAVCIAYVFMLSASGGAWSLWSSPSLIRIPFLFTAAVFYGYLVDRVRREQQRARAEVETVARLEETQEKLADHALQLEQANKELKHEISERKRAEQDLKAAKEYAENLIESSLDMIISADMDRNIVEFNRAAEETFGHSKPEIEGKPVDILYADASQGTQVYGELMKHGQFKGEVWNRRKNGETFCSYLSVSVIRDTNGADLGTLGTSRDITERKRAEEALRAQAHELAAQTQRLEVLSTLSRTMVSTLDVQLVINAIAHAAAQLFENAAANLWLTEEDGETLTLRADTARLSQLREYGKIPVGQGVVGWIAQQKKPILLDDIQKDPRAKNVDFHRAENIHATMGMPLVVGEKCLGSLTVNRRSFKTFDEKDLGLLSAFAAHAVIAIENANHMQHARDRAGRLRILSEVTRLMTSSLDHQQVVGAIVKAAAELLGADLIRLWVVDEATGRLDLQASHGREDLAATPFKQIGKGKGVIGAIWANGEPAFISDLRTERRWLNTPLLEHTGIRSFAGMPLTIENRVMGVLSIFRSEVRNFASEERELMELFAGQAAISLKKARLYREVAEQKQQLEETVRERERAEETVRLIVEGTSPVIGKDFFRSLVRHLAVALQVRFAFISELVDEEGKRVRTLAFWTGQDFGQNFEYDTKGTPCENAIIGKGLSYYPEGVQRVFPDDRWLAEAGIESYLGIPFFNSLGKVTGHMGVMDHKPIVKEHRIESILKIFATRVSVELERKRAEEELKGAQLQLMQSAKLESVGRLGAGVAHEVKNPLAIIRQGLAYLSHAVSTTDDDTVAPVLEKMDNAITRADRVIRGLLDFSAPTALDVTTAELNAVVEQALLLVKHELVRAHVTVVKALGAALPPLQLDRQKMEQVFVNLFMNAIQAMSDGGTLTIKTYSKPLTEFGPDVGCQKSDHFRIGETLILLEVEDTGSGIPDDKLDRVFEPFFTTKPTGQGSGLGLTVTRKIMELHGGTIDIRNRHEGGVRVTLTFKTEGGHADAEETDPARRR